jgi:hypothetical protein
MLLNMFWALLFPSSGALSNCSGSLRFPVIIKDSVVVNNCDCSLKELLMMDIIMPETC